MQENGHTVVELFKCHACQRLVLSEDVARGQGCPCGSMKVMHAKPTTWNVIKFFARKPKMLGTYFVENILGYGND